MSKKESSMVQNDNIETILQEKGKVVTVPIGISMWPMLKNRKDHIVIVPVTRPLKRFDVPLYRKRKDRYTLHRIIKIRKDGGYVICGDNLWRKEYDVTDEQIVGVLAGFFKGEKYIDCETNRCYHAYVYFCRATYWIRSIFLIGKECGGRVKRGIKGVLNGRK